MGFPLDLFMGPPKNRAEPIRVSIAESIQRTLAAGRTEDIEMQHRGKSMEWNLEPRMSWGEGYPDNAVDKALEYLTYGDD